MKLRDKLESNLDKIVEAISKVEGVLAIILFGSRARGNYDECSDYDVLVIFRDDETMWKNRRKIYENVGRLKLFMQVLTRSIREVREETEPTFLESVMGGGKLLYMRYPLQSPAFFQELRSMVIVSYSLNRLPQREKMKVIYRLFRKRFKGKSGGFVEESGGLRLGDGCFMIPEDHLRIACDILEQYGVRYTTMKVLVRR
jgi:predicted nucleotidyltransferase